MKPIAALLLGLLLSGGARAHSMCDAAQEGVHRLALSNRMTAEVTCRDLRGRELQAGTSWTPLERPEATAVSSGPMGWPVRAQTEDGHTHVKRVPLTVAWSAPAWVSTRNLAPGAWVSDDDLILQWRRWPEGMPVVPASTDTMPRGRLRTTVRAGDIVSPEKLLPPGVLLRGDEVTAVLMQGAVEVRMPVKLLAQSQVGDAAQAQAAGRIAPIQGHLTDLRTLTVVRE